jgi:hypothetical protein
MVTKQSSIFSTMPTCPLLSSTQQSFSMQTDLCPHFEQHGSPHPHAFVWQGSTDLCPHFEQHGSPHPHALVWQGSHGGGEQGSHGSQHWSSQELSHFGGHGSQHPLDLGRHAADSKAEVKSHAQRAGIDINAVIARV